MYVFMHDQLLSVSQGLAGQHVFMTGFEFVIQNLQHQ